MRDGKGFVRCANLTDKSVDIEQGEGIGTFVCLSGKDCLIKLPDEKTVTNVPKPSKKSTTSVDIDSELDNDKHVSLTNLVHEYRDIFSSTDGNVGKCDIIKHDIHVDRSQVPIRQRAYRLSHQQKVVMDSILDDMLQNDIIQESTSSWASPCMLVSKKNNAGYRFVCDYRKLNECTQIQAQPIPTVEEALDSIGTQCPAWFSSLDLHSGFFQVVIDQKSRPYTAFRTHRGLHEFKRLPMGLANSPGTFQRVLEAVLRRGLSYKSCLIYLDDVIVMSRTFDEHLVHLREVFDSMRAAGLKLKDSTCHFAKSQLRYLGHVVSADGIKPDDEKVQAVQNYPVPKNLKDLRAFLGLSGYYRKFIKGHSDIASVLYVLTKKGQTFPMDRQRTNCIRNVKTITCKPASHGIP